MHEGQEGLFLWYVSFLSCSSSVLICVPVSNKAKECVPAVPKTKESVPAAAKAKMPVPAPAPKAKMPVPVAALAAGSATDTSPNVGESDVEIVSESTVNEDATVVGKTIVVQHAKRPLASRPAPGPKCPRLNLEAQLEESQIEAAQLQICNTELEAEVMKWKTTIIDMWHHSRVQEAEVMAMSNRIYCMGRNWGAWEKEIAEMLEK